MRVLEAEAGVALTWLKENQILQILTNAMLLLQRKIEKILVE